MSAGREQKSGNREDDKHFKLPTYPGDAGG